LKSDVRIVLQPSWTVRWCEQIVRTATRSAPVPVPDEECEGCLLTLRRSWCDVKTIHRPIVRTTVFCLSIIPYMPTRSKPLTGQSGPFKSPGRGSISVAQVRHAGRRSAPGRLHGPCSVRFQRTFRARGGFQPAPPLRWSWEADFCIALQGNRELCTPPHQTAYNEKQGPPREVALLLSQTLSFALMAGRHPSAMLIMQQK
jgi:hypothetical protein